jgi:hypothetical protein
MSLFFIHLISKIVVMYSLSKMWIVNFVNTILFKKATSI